MIRMMESVRETEKRYCSVAMFTAIFIGLFFILAGYKPVGKGFILGTVFSSINFVLMGETLAVRLGSSRKRATAQSMLSILLRYILMAVPLFMGIKLDAFNIFAVIAGLFMVQIIIMADHLFGMVFSKHGKQI